MFNCKKIYLFISIFIIGVAILAIDSYANNRVEPQFNLIPMPREILMKNGTAYLDNRWVICINNNQEEDRFAAELLSQEAEKSLGLHWNIITETEKKNPKFKYIRLENIPVQDTDLTLFKEQGYRLFIGNKEIRIEAPTAGGRFYGVQTLRQLIRTAHRKSLPQLAITDYPSLSLRGISDDISRGQVSTLDNFKSVIAELAFYKMNIYMPYIEDMFSFDTDPNIGRTRGAITKPEMAQMAAIAKQYHITLCPVFECLGHQDRLLSLPENRKYAELQDTAKPPWSFSPVLPESNEFVKALIDELVAATPDSEYFHIGCDESYDIGQGASKDKVAEIGIGRVHAEYFTRLHDYLNDRYQRKTMVYGDMLLRHPESMSYVPKNCIIVDWNYQARLEYPSIQRFIDAGFTDIIVSPGIQSWNCFYPNYEQGFANIYSFAEVAKQERLLGCIVSSWGDNGAENLRENNMTEFAYSAAVSWEPAASSNHTEFLQRYAAIYYGVKNPEPLAKAEELLGFMPEIGRGGPTRLFHAAIKLRKQDADVVTTMEPLSIRMQQVQDILSEEFSKIKYHADHIDSLNHTAQRYIYIANKVLTQEAITAKLNAIPFMKRTDADKTEIIDSLISLREQLLDIYSEYAHLWLRNNKYPELDFNLERISQQIAQLQNMIVTASAGELDAVKPMEAVWMWYPDIQTTGTTDTGVQKSNSPAVSLPTEPTQSASTGTFYFIRPIDINKKGLQSAELIIWSNNEANLTINGTQVVRVMRREPPQQVQVKELLSFGQNIIAVEATNMRSGPVGLVLELRLTHTDGTKETITGDELWRVSNQLIPDWYKSVPLVTDPNWVAVKILGKGLIPPWSSRID
jgi:hexosaminidase